MLNIYVYFDTAEWTNSETENVRCDYKKKKKTKFGNATANKLF